MAEKPSMLVLSLSFWTPEEEQWEEVSENFFALTPQFDVTVGALLAPNVTGNAEHKGIRVLSLKRPENGMHFGWRNAWRWLLLLMRERTQKRFVLIHAVFASAPGIIGTILSMIFRIPLVVTVAGGECVHLPEIGYGGLASPRSRLQLRVVLRRASAVLVGSEHQRQHVSMFRPATAKKIILAPLGVAQTKFPFVLRPSPRREIVLLAAGSLNRVKNYPLLLRAFVLARQTQPRITLRIAGERVPERFQGIPEQLHALVEQLHVAEAVEFIGWIDHARLAEEYHNAHLFVHTSLSESQGMVIAEALFTGLPVISTAVGVAPEILTGKCGVYVNQFDEKSVAHAITRMVERIQSDEYTAMQQAARDAAQRFEMARTSAALARVYTDVLKHIAYDA